MKKIKSTGIVLFLVLTLCLSVCPVIGVQASTLSGDMVEDFELNDIAYYNASGARVYKVEAGEITCKVNVLNNSAAAKELMLISAVYDTSGEIQTMTTAGVGKGTVASKTRADLTATVNVDSATDRIIKTFIWDTTGRSPYKEVASLTTLSGKKFDKAFIYYARVLSTGTETTRRSYQGIVDEHKGTITFEIPYSQADATAKTLKNNSPLQFVGFYFTGTDTTDIACDVEGFENSVTSMTKYDNYADGRLAYKGEFTTVSEMDISKKRPTFTFTAEDGSKASYKVNILLLVVDDDFENTTTANNIVTSTSNKTFYDPNTKENVEYASWTWYWTRTFNDAAGFAGAEEDTDGNGYLTVRKGTADTNRNSLQIRSDTSKVGMRDPNGTLIPLHNAIGTDPDTTDTDTRFDDADVDGDGYLDDVSVLVEYDWRYRPVTIGDTEYCDFHDSYIFVRNNSDKQFIKAEGVQGGKRKWNGSAMETVTYNSNTWYHDRIVLEGFDGTKKVVTSDQTCRIYAEEFELTNQTAINDVGTSAVDIRVNDVCIRTGGSATRLSTLDLDNLKIGLLFE